MNKTQLFCDVRAPNDIQRCRMNTFAELKTLILNCQFYLCVKLIGLHRTRNE